MPDITHTVLASVPLAGILYTVVAEVAYSGAHVARIIHGIILSLWHWLNQEIDDPQDHSP